MAPFLKQQARALAAQIVAARDGAAKLAKDDGADASHEADASDEAEIDRILAALDFGEWVELRDRVRGILLQIANDGVAQGFNQIGFTAGDDITAQVNQHALEWAEARAAELVGMRQDDAGNLVPNPNADWAITDGTRDMLRSDVADAIAEGLSSDDLADHLEGSYAFSEARAETIARTELANADVQGNLIAYRDSGVVSGKELVLSSEHDAPDECDDAAAMGVVPLDDDFGGAGDPPFHPNCECDILPVLAADE